MCSKAVADLRIGYPVAIDNDYAIWRAFDNSIGRRTTSSTRRAVSATMHFGEGDYDGIGARHPAAAAEAGKSERVRAAWSP